MQDFHPPRDTEDRPEAIWRISFAVRLEEQTMANVPDQLNIKAIYRLAYDFLPCSNRSFIRVP